MEGGWEHLRVLEVSDSISYRANFGAVKVYRCEAVGSGKIYPRIDLSSWRGAEGACQVKGVKRAPRGARGAATAATPGATPGVPRSAALAARGAPNQTRSKVACWARYTRVGGDDDPVVRAKE